jgi:hypothetical protein
MFKLALAPFAAKQSLVSATADVYFEFGALYVRVGSKPTGFNRR